MKSATEKVSTEDGKGNDPPEISKYEIIRAQNIERNNAKLRQLGLLSAQEEKASNDAAWGRRKPTQSTNSMVKPSCNTKRKNENESKPSRFSKRIRNLKDNVQIENKNDEGIMNDIEKERKAIVTECREARMRAAVEVAKADPDGVTAAMKNRTATYEHCIMRVRTMNEAGLLKRIKVIERAAGKHCVIKMAIFKSCLQDEGYWTVASAANEALERLKAIKPPPASLDI